MPPKTEKPSIVQIEERPPTPELLTPTRIGQRRKVQHGGDMKSKGLLVRFQDVKHLYEIQDEPLMS